MQFVNSRPVALCLCLTALLFAVPATGAEQQPDSAPPVKAHQQSRDIQEHFKDEEAPLPLLQTEKQTEAPAGIVPQPKKLKPETLEHSVAEKAEPTAPLQPQAPPALPVPVMSEMEQKKSKLRMLRLDLQIVETTRQVKEIEKELRSYNRPAKSTVRRAPAVKKKAVVPPVVLSVQGLDTKLSATLRFEGTTRTVYAGDTVGKQTISAITKNYVQLSDGSMLRFKE
ncbi:hypothetical protein [Halodesulfovibrio sp.]|jgi:type IV pilus biogenesis protein PilP|uniref:hypothetical protein n=1 Tax=Halodesulfovibrio sp. TaxID=1912772 RepID=UPI0025FC2B7E|nr:hypothetical protein [Halodesulfovibrio sp.]MCT4625659.1 hypothetical protein [Halodesulfovibrio sp.]